MSEECGPIDTIFYCPLHVEEHEETEFGPPVRLNPELCYYSQHEWADPQYLWIWMLLTCAKLGKLLFVLNFFFWNLNIVSLLYILLLDKFAPIQNDQTQLKSNSFKNGCNGLVLDFFSLKISSFQKKT